MTFRYKITFFKNEISSQDWLSFFQTVLENTTSAKITVLFQQPNVDFYIDSNKRIDVINSKLFPMFLTDEFSEKENTGVIASSSGLHITPIVITKDLFGFIEKENLNNKNIVSICFVINKYNPLKTLPILKLTYHDTQFRYLNGLLFIHINDFLAFDLTKSIRSEIARVKPVLATNNLHISTTEQGFLSLRNKNWEAQNISAKSYDFSRHSLILGQSGSGKSYLMAMMLEDLHNRFGDEYGVVLIDPHASIEPLTSAVPDKISINFKDVQTNLFINIGQSTLSTELAIDLLSTVLDVKANQDLNRVLKFSLKLLFSTNQMTLPNLRGLLTDTIIRKQLLKETEDTNLLQFFETEYQQLNATKYDSAILPIINLISELDFINPNATKIDLTEAMNNHFLVSIPIKQTDLGKNITKVVGGAIIQQVFTIMQAGLVHKKIILMIDEFSVVQNPSLIHILSEARKFGLTVVFAQQYLMQVPLELLQSIFANMVNYFCFKVARDDAEVIARNLNFEIDEYFLKNKNDPREVLELGVKLLTDLNPRETICRLMVDGQYVTPFKSKTTTHASNH